MRHIFVRLVLFALLASGLPSSATAQSAPTAAPSTQAVAVHHVAATAPVTTTAAAPASGTTSPAKGLASTIIPGSPLAALTGSSPATPDDDTTPTPFGTDNFGLSVIGHIANDAAGTISEFASAVQHSTNLTPIWQWLKTFTPGSNRVTEAKAAGTSLVLALVPAWLLEWAIRLLLTRPRTAIRNIAVARRQSELPDEEDAEGLADAEAGETEKPPTRWLSVRGWLNRFGLASAYILLSLLPVIVFVVTTGLLVGSGAVSGKTAKLIVVGVGNAYLFCRLSYEALQFILAPYTPDLRLIQTSNFRARWLLRALMLVAITIAAGFGTVSTAEVLGLAHEGALVAARLFALLVHIELAILVWQSRHVVASWIRGNKEEAEQSFGLRPRLAAIWHILALFYIFALWVAYAGGIHNAFGVLLRIVAVFVGTLVVARLVWLGLVKLLDEVFNDADAEIKKHPTLRARAKSYNPLLKLLFRILIAVLVVIIILQGWGFGVIPWLLRNPLCLALASAFFSIVVTIAIALTLWEVSNVLINSRIDRLAASGRSRQASRLRTLLPMLKATIGVSIGLVAGLICLSKIGVNAAPLLAGAGVLGIAIGFGSQKLVQDIITGLFLLLEDAMQVGDVITLAGMTGTVERLSIRTIRLRGGDGSVNIIPFSAVTTVTNQTRDFGYAQISIQVGYEEDLTRVYNVMSEIARDMRTESRWAAMIRDDLKIFGLDQFGASALVITGQIRTGPGQHWAVRREYYTRIKKRFEAEHIDMPYTYLPPAPPKTTQAEAAQIAAPHKDEANTSEASHKN